MCETRTAGGKFAPVCTLASELTSDKLYENQCLLVHLSAGNPQQCRQQTGLGFLGGKVY
jgi:hypothetical protein